MVQVSVLNKAIVATSIVGLFMCFYAYAVERRKMEDPSYTAICDIDEHMSCSRVLTSPYGKGFGVLHYFLEEDHPANVPNSIPGIALFVLFATLCQAHSPWSARVQLGLAIVANIASVYLGTILFFVLKDFCILCVTVYAINFLNLIFSYLRLRALTPKSAKQKGQQKSQKGQQKKQNDKQKSPQAEKKKAHTEKQKSPQAEKQKQQQQNGKVKNQEKQKQQQQNGKVKNQQNGKQSEKQKSPKTPNSKKKN